MTEDDVNRSDPKEDLPEDFRESFFGSEGQNDQDDRTGEISTSGPTTQELRELTPEEIREKYSVEEDHPLVKQTGKSHIERKIEPTAENTVFYLFLQGLHERVGSISSEVQEKLDRSENTRVDLPVGSVGIGIYQIHALTSSFFESGSYLLVTDILRRPDRSIQPFIDYYESTHWKDVLQDDMDQEEIIQAIYKDLENDAKAGQYQHMLNYAGLVDGVLYNLIDDVREARNNYLHNPMLMIEISGHKEVIEMIARCVTLVKEVEDLLESELEIDWTIYNALESIEK